MYHARIERLPYDEQRPERPREELDDELDVASWRVPGRRAVVPAAPVNPDAPSWWHGDEDASQTFLAAMGVRLDGA